MYSPHLHSALANARIDDLRRSTAASRRSAVASHSDCGSRQPRAGGPTNSIRALVARFAH
jgi:hypothetical protein